MISRAEFVTEIKNALDLPESYKIDITEPICSVTTDEMLDPDGFDWKLGEQVFHFNLRNNSNLIDDFQKSPFASFIPEKTRDEIIAILNCENNCFKGMRTSLKRGSFTSRLCRYYLALDYFFGKDGDVDEEKSISLLIETPWCGKNVNLSWIKNITHKQNAAKLCIQFYSKETIAWDYGGKQRSVTNYSGSLPFFQLLSNIKGSFDPIELNNYGVYLWETHRPYDPQSFDAFNFFLLAEKFGQKRDHLYYILGVCYLFGIDNPKRVKVSGCPGFRWSINMNLAKHYFEIISDKSVYNYESYSYLSAINWWIHDNSDEALENDRLGAENKFENSQIIYGLKLVKKAIEQRLLHIESQELYNQGISYIKESFSGKKAYWINDFGDFIIKEHKQKCLELAQKSWEENKRLDLNFWI